MVYNFKMDYGIQDGKDKLIEAAVEKTLFIDCQNLEAHVSSVILRRTPNINLSWGLAHETYARTVIISSFHNMAWQPQHRNRQQHDEQTSVFYCGASGLFPGT